MAGVKVAEVFKTQGQPTFTYINRDEGEYERRLSNAIDSKGLLCLLTGPSKTGKTTLYTKVANSKKLEVLKVRCNISLKANDLWKSALEQVSFERVKQTQKQSENTTNASAELSGTIGWNWLASLTGKTGTAISNKRTESETRERVLSEVSPEQLLPILKKLPFLLVIEDFHYLSQETQVEVFQQWKVFVDNEVSVVVVETTHHSADIAFSNKDLVGRIAHIELGTWRLDDLKRIPQQGLRHFNLNMPERSLELLAQESAGLPIIVQQACLQMLLANGVTELPVNRQPDLTASTVYNSLHQVAIERYGSFKQVWDSLCRGPRKEARRYDTYELVLSTFCLDPITFQLGREEIEPRLKKLPISESDVPPSGSVTSMLKALGSFQDRIGIQLLEWSEKDKRLYITEPSFLFYLRWKEPKQRRSNSQEVLKAILENMRIIEEYNLGQD